MTSKQRRDGMATHVYAAQGRGLVKVGASRSVDKRAHGLRKHWGRPFEIKQTWQHSDPYAIEAMVCEVFEREDVIVLGDEVFAVEMAELVVEIERAIERYERTGMTRASRIGMWDVREIRVRDNRDRGFLHFYREPHPAVINRFGRRYGSTQI